MTADGVYGENTEMYLKTLVELAADREVVPVTGLAERLGISTVSASEKVRRLQDQGFLEHLPYKGVSLTEAGRKRANTVLRRHRLWERFLVDYLNVDWQHAHDAACRLEHATSREISERLAVFLDGPETCPHGNPIPGAGALSSPTRGMRLMDLDPASQFVVLSVFPESTPLLEGIAALGLLPGTRCEVIATTPADGSIEASIEGKRIDIPAEFASHLYVHRDEQVTA
ncbi:MAG: metal-dependent transcriptional regulator [Anaerolineales bacterium]|jgi:DtxR family Mn-dependent transcriptional regulator